MASSTTQLTIGEGIKTLTTQLGLVKLKVGDMVTVGSLVSPDGYYMKGPIQSYSQETGQLTFNSIITSGSGTFSSWVVGILIGPPGPPYPPNPPGSNAVGLYKTAFSPVGTLPPFDVWATIMSQYANSPILTQIITNYFDYLDQTKNFDAFFDLIWNVDTAQGYGLDVWGRIVGITREIHVTSQKWFGFNEMGTLDADGFNPQDGINGSPFYSGENLFGCYLLEDHNYRNLILIKAAANITDGSIPSINAMLMTLFPHRGNAYVTEGADFAYFGFMEEGNAHGFNQAPFYNGEPIPYMRMTYTFTFPLTPVELGIVQTSGVLPKPTGVLATVVTP